MLLKLFPLEELKITLNIVKERKTTGYDGLFPEFQHFQSFASLFFVDIFVTAQIIK